MNVNIQFYTRKKFMNRFEIKYVIHLLLLLLLFWFSTEIINNITGSFVTLQFIEKFSNDIYVQCMSVKMIRYLMNVRKC